MGKTGKREQVDCHWVSCDSCLSSVKWYLIPHMSMDTYVNVGCIKRERCINSLCTSCWQAHFYRISRCVCEALPLNQNKPQLKVIQQRCHGHLSVTFHLKPINFFSLGLSSPVISDHLPNLFHWHHFSLDDDLFQTDLFQVFFNSLYIKHLYTVISRL